MPPARDCIPRSVASGLMLGASVLEFAALVGSNVALWSIGPPGSIAATMGAFFLLYLSLDACWKRNMVQIVAALAFNTLLLVHGAQSLAETRANNLGMGVVGEEGDASWLALATTLMAVQLGCVALGEIGMGVAAWLAWREWGWSIFTVVGTEPRLVKAYRAYHIYLCLLKFCWFFVLYNIVEGFVYSSWLFSSFLGLIIGVVILVVLVVEWVGLRWERRWVLWTLLIFNLAAVFWLGASVIVSDIQVNQYSSYSNYSPYSYGGYSSGQEYLRPLKYSNIVFFNYVFIFYLARFILSCVNWHWIGRGIYSYNVASRVRGQRETAAMGMAERGTLPPTGTGRLVREDIQYQGLPLGEAPSSATPYDGPGERDPFAEAR